MTPKGFLPKQSRQKLAFQPEQLIIASGYQIDVSVKTDAFVKSTTITEASMVVVRIGGTKSHQSIPMRRLCEVLECFASPQEAWLDVRACWQIELPCWSVRLSTLIERLASECNIRGGSLVFSVEYRQIIQSRSESQSHITEIRQHARRTNTGSKPSRTRRIDGIPAREEIDRAEAESCGIVPLKRGLESDEAYSRRSERHERSRYGRSQFD